MKTYITYLLCTLVMISCTINKSVAKEGDQQEQIGFEEYFHAPIKIINEKTMVVNSQQQMDALYNIIHQQTPGNRKAPILMVGDGDLYIALSPDLKTSNDIEIMDLYYHNKILTVDVAKFDNPQLDPASRIKPNIIIKLNKLLDIKTIKINYKN